MRQGQGRPTGPRVDGSGLGGRGKPSLVGCRGRPSLPGCRGRPSLLGCWGTPSLPGCRGRPSLLGCRGRPSLLGCRVRPALKDCKGWPSLPACGLSRAGPLRSSPSVGDCAVNHEASPATQQHGTETRHRGPRPAGRDRIERAADVGAISSGGDGPVTRKHTVPAAAALQACGADCDIQRPIDWNHW